MWIQVGMCYALGKASVVPARRPHAASSSSSGGWIIHLAGACPLAERQLERRNKQLLLSLPVEIGHVNLFVEKAGFEHGFEK
jgi:hypothetical protein